MKKIADPEERIILDGVITICADLLSFLVKKREFQTPPSSDYKTYI
jgi:hypothetical protein